MPRGAGAHPCDKEFPDGGVFEIEIAVAVCYDCEKKVGPTHAEDVGLELHLYHSGCETEVLSQWTETAVIPEIFFDGE